MRSRLAGLALFVALVSTAWGRAQTPAPAGPPEPTFSKDVVRVLASNCMSCHHKGGIAPMPLTTFEETRPHAKAIRDEVSARSMPPWHSAGARGVFANDPTLSDADLGTLVAWVDAGAPRGNDKDLPKLPDFTVEWPLGRPDLVLQPDRPYTNNARAALQSVPILNPRFQIPAGAPAYEVRAAYTVPEDIEVISVLPHMHWLGQSMEVTATMPGGEAQLLIRVPKYDFNWQRTYTYRSRVALPKGTRIDVVAIFDNSEGNPSNPNKPPRPVRFGEATTDEMNVAYLTYVLKK